jgi:hypothetical protein
MSKRPDAKENRGYNERVAHRKDSFAVRGYLFEPDACVGAESRRRR